MTALKFNDDTIARLIAKGVDAQTKIPDDRGLYVSIGTSGTASFVLRYTDKRVTQAKQAYHILGSWHADLFPCSKAIADAAVWRDNIRSGIYPSKRDEAGGGITFPDLLNAYIADLQVLVKKPVQNRKSEFIVEPRLRTWKQYEYALDRAAKKFHNRFAATLNKNDMGALLDAIEANAMSNNVRDKMKALCKWANNTTNPATGKPYLEINWFTDFMKPRRKHLNRRPRLKGEPIAVLFRTLRNDAECPGSEHARRALALMMCTALRGKEVCSLKRSDVIDIDGINPRLYIHPSVVKMARYMVVPLNTFAVEIIKEAMASHEHEALFPNQDGQCILRPALTQTMNEKGRRNVMDYLGWTGTPQQVSPHALRRTAASMLRAKGFGYDLAEIALILDHQSGGDDEDHQTTSDYADDFTINDNTGDDFHGKRIELQKALEHALRSLLEPMPAAPADVATNVVSLRAA